MKLPILCSGLLLGSLAAPAVAGPDFSTATPRGGELTASSGTREILPSEDLIFGHNSATLSESGQQQLETVARYLKLRRDLTLVIEGYTDHTGDAAYNMDLATRRAAAVRSWLRVHGVPSDRMVLAIYGESVADPAGNVLDRRVVVIASPRRPRELATHALDIRRALTAPWTTKGTNHTEERSSHVVRISRR